MATELPINFADQYERTFNFVGDVYFGYFRLKYSFAERPYGDSAAFLHAFPVKPIEAIKSSESVRR